MPRSAATLTLTVAATLDQSPNGHPAAACRTSTTIDDSLIARAGSMISGSRG
ncbi:MAG TPA: hypothetical protein VK279_11905 [Solirubrobacteraceae bacterium]|nr:hypothetical protein [Solirubrobacteraceae bacterium]